MYVTSNSAFANGRTVTPSELTNKKWTKHEITLVVVVHFCDICKSDTKY